MRQTPPPIRRIVTEDDAQGRSRICFVLLDGSR